MSANCGFFLLRPPPCLVSHHDDSSEDRARGGHSRSRARHRPVGVAPLTSCQPDGEPPVPPPTSHRSARELFRRTAQAAKDFSPPWGGWGGDEQRAVRPSAPPEKTKSRWLTVGFCSHRGTPWR